MLKTIKIVILLTFLLQLINSLHTSQQIHHSSTVRMTHLLKTTELHLSTPTSHQETNKNLQSEKYNPQTSKESAQLQCLECKTSKGSKNGEQQHLSSMSRCSGVTPVWNGKECKACPLNSNFSSRLNFCVVCVAGTFFNAVAQRCVAG